MENADGGFAGEQELMNQFGLQNLSEATFVVNKTRFQELTKQITIESGTSADVDGTGENVGGRHVAYGDGIYRSDDEGKSWKNMGLKN